MEFDKWIKKKVPNIRKNTVLEIGLRQAWEAGVENERKACAKACEEFAQHMSGASNLSWAAGMDCAVLIRKRSNV